VGKPLDKDLLNVEPPGTRNPYGSQKRKKLAWLVAAAAERTKALVFWLRSRNTLGLGSSVGSGLGKCRVRVRPRVGVGVRRREDKERSGKLFLTRRVGVTLEDRRER
jgi:hypothetical protein